jgi:hypothetical protein
MAVVLEGAVEVCRHDLHPAVVVPAPPRTRISLEFLHTADPVVVRVSGNTVSLAGQVVYRVVGWDALGSALLAELVEDRRAVR